jgi:hypothetical protein
MPRKSSVLHDLGRKAATNFKNSVLKLPPQTLAVLELPAHMRTRAQVIELVTHLSVRSLCALRVQTPPSLTVVPALASTAERFERARGRAR